MKYIIFENIDYSLEVPVIFPEIIDHSTIAKMIGIKPKSAEFCTLNNNNFQCYGKSQTLNLNCDKDDDYILNKMKEVTI